MDASPLPPAQAQETETILFRPSKKRKIYRQRARDDEDEVATTEPRITTAVPPIVEAALQSEQSLEELIAASGVRSASTADGDEVEGTAVSLAEILRLRKRNKRLAGVEFRVQESRFKDGEEEGERGLVLHHQDVEGERSGEVIEGGLSGPRRFAPQTGTVGDVNKHMMEYVDSQIAKRRAEAQSASKTPSSTFDAEKTTPAETVDAPQSSSSNPPKVVLDVQRQPATLGRLQEVDLGAESRALNEERTRRKVAGERSLEEEEDAVNEARKVKKVRLGPDGKPWRSRRKRRGSEDVKRDLLVEAVLRENRLELYEEPTPSIAHATGGQDEEYDGAADDRIAEAFRQEFMDSMAQRKRKPPGPAMPAARTAPGAKKEEEALKGPKLGGSRNSRAAMRDAMLRAAKK